MLEGNRIFLVLPLIGFIIFFSFSYAYAVDNNCQVGVIHIIQVPNILVCLEDRIDIIENIPVNTFLGSPDISITQENNTIIIDFNGTGSDTTVCNNVGTGNPLHKTGTNCSAFSLIAGNDFTITNSTDDYTLAVLRKGQMVAHVFQSVTKTNIGTGYIDVYATLWDNEEQVVIDFTNISDCAIAYMWDYVGTGTQQLRWIDLGSNVLYESPTFTSDRNPHVSALGSGWSGWFSKPVGTTGIQIIEQQGKSTVAGDDPIGKGYAIFCR